MKRYTRIPGVRIFSAPLYFHWSAFVIIAVLLLHHIDEPGIAVVAVVSYVGLILLHEAGHAYVAKQHRLRRHAIRVAAFHGVCEFEEPEYAKQDYLVAWGGVLAQLLVAVPVILLDVVFDIGQVDLLGPAVAIFGYVSVAIAALNLIPAHGLDGDKAWQLFPLLLEERRERTFRPGRKRRSKP